ncbi:MAG: division/cell wall cluster transcriptional repressor MraZ [Candidatus Sungbacteria bacterium]|nr:division/cell wall cluster transcriptional repressor MraZ [Candidatus Sungbacteria bacterium]
MFIGEFYHSLDAKGRLAVPTKFKADLRKGSVVTRGLDASLWLFPHDQWEALAAKLAALPLSKSNSRAFARLMLAGAMDMKMDRQGRILVPDYLRSYAALKKRAVLAGIYNRIEIWDEDTWNTYKKSTEKESDNIAEQLEII